MKNRLQKHIAALLEHHRTVGEVNCLHQLVSLLDEIDADAVVRLRSVPFAAAFAAEPCHDFPQIRKIEPPALSELHRGKFDGFKGQRDVIEFSRFRSVAEARNRLRLPAVKVGKTLKDGTAVGVVHPADGEGHPFVDCDTFGQDVIGYVNLPRAGDGRLRGGGFIRHIRSPRT